MANVGRKPISDAEIRKLIRTAQKKGDTAFANALMGRIAGKPMPPAQEAKLPKRSYKAPTGTRRGPERPPAAPASVQMDDLAGLRTPEGMRAFGSVGRPLPAGLPVPPVPGTLVRRRPVTGPPLMAKKGGAVKKPVRKMAHGGAVKGTYGKLRKVHPAPKPMGTRAGPERPPAAQLRRPSPKPKVPKFKTPGRAR